MSVAFLKFKNLPAEVPIWIDIEGYPSEALVLLRKDEGIRVALHVRANHQVLTLSDYYQNYRQRMRLPNDKPSITDINMLTHFYVKYPYRVSLRTILLEWHPDNLGQVGRPFCDEEDEEIDRSKARELLQREKARTDSLRADLALWTQISEPTDT
jgi:hypothetical protein